MRIELLGHAELLPYCEKMGMDLCVTERVEMSKDGGHHGAYRYIAKITNMEFRDSSQAACVSSALAWAHTINSALAELCSVLTMKWAVVKDKETDETREWQLPVFHHTVAIEEPKWGPHVH